jgi:DNA-binding transcriptional LysR family regulator
MYKGNLLKHLRAFIQTARTGSVSAAADKLFLSQPSISQQIRALEEELDKTLFERHGPRHAIDAGRQGLAGDGPAAG